MSLITRDFFEAPRRGRWIVTHGYSKTVRNALKRGLARSGECDSVFVMFAEGDDYRDAQRMVYELCEGEEGAGILAVSRGDESILPGLLKQHDDVIVTLGAEVFEWFILPESGTELLA